MLSMSQLSLSGRFSRLAPVSFIQSLGMVLASVRTLLESV